MEKEKEDTDNSLSWHVCTDVTSYTVKETNNTNSEFHLSEQVYIQEYISH